MHSKKYLLYQLEFLKNRPAPFVYYFEKVLCCDANSISSAPDIYRLFSIVVFVRRSGWQKDTFLKCIFIRIQSAYIFITETRWNSKIAYYFWFLFL